MGLPDRFMPPFDRRGPPPPGFMDPWGPPPPHMRGPPPMGFRRPPPPMGM
jgi:hypothetical protein